MYHRFYGSGSCRFGMYRFISHRFSSYRFDTIGYPCATGSMCSFLAGLVPADSVRTGSVCIGSVVTG